MIPEHVRNRNGLIIEVLAALGVDAGVYWTSEGPTLTARELKKDSGASDVSTWVRLAWALYDGDRSLSVAELLETDEQKCIHALTLLMRIPLGTVGLTSLAAASGSSTDEGGGESIN